MPSRDTVIFTGRVIGCVLAVIFWLTFTGQTDWFPGFKRAMIASHELGGHLPNRYEGGLYLFASVAVFFLVSPHTAAEKCFPINRATGRPVLGPGSCQFLGYLAASLEFAIIWFFETLY